MRIFSSRLKRTNTIWLLLLSVLIFSFSPFLLSFHHGSLSPVFRGIEIMTEEKKGFDISSFLVARQFGRLSYLYDSRQVSSGKIHKDFNDSIFDLSRSGFADNLSPGCMNWTDEKEKHCNGHTCKRIKADVFQRHMAPINGERCKTLWFAGFSICSTNCKEAGYALDYAVALQSAIYHASEALQPVLILGRYGCKGKKIPKIAEWAMSKGAVVIIVDKLSFQEVVDSHLAQNASPGLSMGPYLRLDIPAYIQKHGLMELPLVCQRHVLYTDSDIIFANPITQADIDGLKVLSSEVSDAYVVYGRETNFTGSPFNTGVMIIDIPRFDLEWPSILKFGMENGPFPAYDQGWLNQYFLSSPSRIRNRTLLSNHWNWKTYWQLLPQMWDRIKIIHLHGPKPSFGLLEMSICCTTRKSLLRFPRSYRRLIRNGICCNRGRTASQVLRLFEALSPPFDSIC